MNYIKPEDIKEYVSKNPEGIAGMSEELADMVNHFAELIVRECATAIIQDSRLNDVRSAANGCVRTIREHFGVEE